MYERDVGGEKYEINQIDVTKGKGKIGAGVVRYI